MRVLVSRGKPRRGHFETAQYELRVSESRNGIHANFGRLGTISVRFKASGRLQVRESHKPKGCKGARTIVRKLGTFVGTIRFDGEEGYTEVAKHRVKGSLGTPTKVVCAFTSASSNRQPQGYGAYLGATAHHNRLGFAADRERAKGRAAYVADLRERSGRISIWRYVSLQGPSRGFTFDQKLTSATVAPPPPFSGGATFQGGKQLSFSWAGSLAVSFPGAANVPLTGTDFFALLTRG